MLAILLSARHLAGVFILGFSLCVGLSGCALVLPQTTALRELKPAGLPDQVELQETPFVAQSDYQCGPAALSMLLTPHRPEIKLEELIQQVYLPGRQGSLQVEMLAAPRRHGLVSYPLAPRLEDVMREVAAGNPVIVLQNFGLWPVSLWHYAVVIGYDYPKGELILRSGEKRRLLMPFEVMEYTWEDGGYWSMVVLPPEKIPVTAAAQPYLESVAALERVKQNAAAKTAYQGALQRWPDSTTARLGLSNTHYALGELKQAEDVLRRALEIQPESVIFLNNLAQTLSDLGRNAEALTLVDQALALGGPYMKAVSETRAQILQRDPRLAPRSP